MCGWQDHLHELGPRRHPRGQTRQLCGVEARRDTDDEVYCLEVAAWRIRVNAISPGAIRTPINMDAWGTPEAYAELMKLVPYKRIGEPEDIGRAAVWLASDYSDYINGICLYVDGGMTLYPGFETGG